MVLYSVILLSQSGIINLNTMKEQARSNIIKCPQYTLTEYKSLKCAV